MNPTAKKKHLLKFFPQEQSQIPACTGHKALHVSGNRMLVLGGGNRYSYMSLKNVMTYHTTTGVWSKLQSFGSVSKYKSEESGASRNGSTVVIVIVIFIR